MKLTSPMISVRSASMVAAFFLVMLTVAQSAQAQSVVVNKYFNGAPDAVELLVITNNLDMRGMIIKDFSASMASDGGGKFQFSTNALWSSVQSGTLIVLRNNNTAADVSAGGADYNLDVGLTNATYFSSLGGTFDIATTDMVMIKIAGSGAAGVTGSIHVLGGGTAGAQYTAAPTPKLISSGTTATGFFAYANNSTQTLADFNGTDATSTNTVLTFGAGNNANNTAYINSLRSGPDAAPTVSSTNPADNATGVQLAANISVTFSEDVTAPASAFSISCVTSGAHTFVLTGGPATFTLNPDTDFAGNEVCTVTVDDAQIADVDTNDPPQNMTADYIFDFTTVDPAACGTAFTATYTIQSNGSASPIVGSTVTTEGVVIGDFQGTGELSGYYIQDPTGDANTATSDGIFVLSSTAVNVGDRVRLTGTVSEQFNNTQLNPVTSVIVCSTGNVLPLPVDYDLPEPSNNDLERVENMLVRFPETLTITGNFLLGRFGELVLSSDGRLFQEHNFDRPGSAGANAAILAEPLRYVLLDDGKSIQNPDPTPYFDANNTRRVGDTVTGLTGVLTYDFSEYRIQPTGTVTFAAANPRTAAPDAVGGTVKVSSFNVLNYFNTFGNGNCTGGPGGATFDCRGATNLAEFNRQREKIIAAIVAINADVTGVVEIENDGTGANSAIQDLVNGLNAATAAGTYAFTEDPTPSPGTDAIKNSIIYKPATVTPVGSAVNDEDPIWTGQARNPLAQTFSLNTNGEEFVFIVNHFTSKSCSASDTGLDADLGQGCDNQQRTLQARALLEFVEERQTTTGEARVLVMGDLNAYGEEDPIFELEDDTSDTLADGPGGLIDLAQRFVPMANRYSYQFDEQSGYLDHAMATKELNTYITGTTIWHINADEPTVLDYNTEFKSVAQQGINVGTPYRSSDHDPIVVGILLLSPTAADGTVSGTITDANGVPLAGAVVNLTGTQNRKFITDANGNYRFENVETNGFYTVRPTRTNYSFSPAERSFSQLGNNTEAAFTGSPSSSNVNLLNTPEYFVRQHYLDFLGREPDESGFNFWSDQILECGSDAGCQEAKRVNVSAAYFLSVEFQRTGGLVDGLYRASYGRAPRYAEFMPDTAALSQNSVVGRGDWEGLLAANKRAFIQSFVNRADFRTAYDGLSDASYVDSLISHTGVNSNERDALVSGLSAGTLTRSDVLLRIAENDGFVQAKRNQAFVMMEYFGYLRRDPDQSGYDFWLQKLNHFDGNFERAEMVKAFISSGEYRARFQR
ncbi:MAG: ExeM/NucH family extracellular endonuclease [Pyrinomonadaceae bacterium]|nr:ExeM/NucH family extracellular endonuclease [Pyrinomonadaceae bacterium]